MIAQLSSAILYVEPSTGEYFIGSPSRYVIHLTYAVCVCLHHQQQAERTGQDRVMSFKMLPEKSLFSLPARVTTSV
jgi:hypothetical protein